MSNLQAGSTSCLYNITISEDSNIEPTEIFSVQASFTAGGNSLHITSYVHIIDNDGMHLAIEIKIHMKINWLLFSIVTLALPSSVNFIEDDSSDEVHVCAMITGGSEATTIISAISLSLELADGKYLACLL